MDDAAIRILLIEDDASDAELVRAYLGETEDVEIRLEHVQQLSTGLKRLADDQFDVVLLDLSLPDTWGLETFSRAQQEHPEVPIVILTGAEVMDLALEAVRQGAADYLFKGRIDGPLLIRAVRYAIERANRQRAERSLLVGRRELAIAHEIQMGLYPIASPVLPGYDIAGTSFPSQPVGGVANGDSQALVTPPATAWERPCWGPRPAPLCAAWH